MEAIQLQVILLHTFCMCISPSTTLTCKIILKSRKTSNHHNTCTEHFTTVCVTVYCVYVIYNTWQNIWVYLSLLLIKNSRLSLPVCCILQCCGTVQPSLMLIYLIVETFNILFQLMDFCLNIWRYSTNSYSHWHLQSGHINILMCGMSNVNSVGWCTLTLCIYETQFSLSLSLIQLSMNLIGPNMKMYLRNCTYITSTYIYISI